MTDYITQREQNVLWKFLMEFKVNFYYTDIILPCKKKNVKLLKLTNLEN